MRRRCEPPSGHSDPPAVEHAADGYRLHASPARRALLWTCGAIALLLGAIGVIVPGLPTTPLIESKLANDTRVVAALGQPRHPSP
jgi:hypothetical protein